MKTIAVVGIGRWGRNLLREFSKISDVKTCLHKGSKETGEWLLKNYPQIKITPSYDEILDDELIKAVIIASPSKTHFQFAKRALDKGKNVFLEKPPTLKLAESKKLFSIAKKNNLILLVGNVLLYHLVFKKILELTRGEEIKFINFTRNKFGTFNEDIIWNLAWHEIIIAIALMGNPQKTSLLSAKGILTKRDIVHAVLDFNKKRWCAISVNRTSKEKNRTVTVATKNKIYLWTDEELYEIKSKNTEPELIYKPDKQPLAVECEAFIKQISGASKDLNDKNLNLEAMKAASRLAGQHSSSSRV